MMNKDKYDSIELEIIYFQVEDVITTSGDYNDDDEYELPKI